MHNPFYQDVVNGRSSWLLILVITMIHLITVYLLSNFDNFIAKLGIPYDASAGAPATLAKTPCERQQYEHRYEYGRPVLDVSHFH